MFWISTKKVLHMRDVIWLNKLYREYYQVKQLLIVEIGDEEDNPTETMEDENKEEVESIK